MVTATYKTPCICVVDDSDDDLLVLRRALKRLDVANPLQRFDRAEQALAFLSSAEGRLANIGLLLLDINLPGKDGVSLLKTLREDSALTCVPVVMFTTSDAPDDIRRSYEAGANAYVTKPVASAGFLEAIDTILTFWLRTARLPMSYFEDN
ncbi:MAG TPA: response regulator [Marinagarivorans sp.]